MTSNFSKKNKYVVPVGEDKWGVKTGGAKKYTRIFEDKKKAISFAQDLAARHNVCLSVQKRDGKFEYHNCNPHEIQKNRHVIKHDNRWDVVKAGSGKVEESFVDKKLATNYAYDRAYEEEVCVLVHDRNGKILRKKCPKQPRKISIKKEKKSPIRFHKKLNTNFMRWLLWEESKLDNIREVQ